ncbi:hypothetical protein [Micromonospora ureilytica]|uniref:hypothetical protein n=1 Tax=Micromonospora ureilytica TaxID=709868 RepID=UPI004039CABE
MTRLDQIKILVLDRQPQVATANRAAAGTPMVREARPVSGGCGDGSGRPLIHDTIGGQTDGE